MDACRISPCLVCGFPEVVIYFQELPAESTGATHPLRMAAFAVAAAALYICRCDQAAAFPLVVGFHPSENMVSHGCITLSVTCVQRGGVLARIPWQS